MRDLLAATFAFAVLLAGLPAGSAAQTVTGTTNNAAEIRVFDGNGKPAGSRPAADVIGHRVVSPDNEYGHIGVETASGVTYLRRSAVAIQGALPPPPGGCLAMGTQGRDGRGTTNGFGNCR
ncbi:hypothetical protein [Muricoccus pecuniae]|uniref:Uncharacterized protein n=1 Tax=Muricoccus pecuniae TaxID=693023 RepID=A0A840Y249_9PROT|nr:hypothetical protein [Roseomonas pecuniae]MBB5695188.1 hypothetical protein [Roseomonas pecuniae]